MRPRLVPEGTAPGQRVTLNSVGALPDGLYACACWCDRGFVVITAADLHAGRTYPCGRPGCAEDRSAAA